MTTGELHDTLPSSFLHFRPVGSGPSISLSLSKRKGSSNLYVKIFKRSAIIFLLGIFLALFPKFDFENLRIVGVLQRIALVYLVCAILYLNTSHSTQLKTNVRFSRVLELLTMAVI